MRRNEAPRRGRGGGRRRAGDASALHLVAHPDDDLYFMNPEVADSLRAGAAVTGVYLTSGEADGHNNRYGTLPSQRPPADQAAYARARQNGLKGAYAAMALGDRTAGWSAELLTSPHGAPIEVFTLDQAPQVRLVFLNLRQHSPGPDGAVAGLGTLWDGSVPDVPTIVPRGSLATAEARYTREQLLQTLVMLLQGFQPTLVRAMDPDPDYQTHDKDNPKHHDSGSYSDHGDHTAAGLFAGQALRHYQRPAGQFTAQAYRGYYNERWPENLMPQAFGAKEFLLNLYGNADGYRSGDPAGDGDYEVAFSSRGTGWGQSTRHRYVGGTDWLRMAPDGRLVAFGVLDQRVAMWSEEQPGRGKWTGPELLDGGPVAPRLAVDLSPDGCWQIFALHAGELDPTRSSREIVTTRQAWAGGLFAPWESLGNSSPSAGRLRQLGTPSVARDGWGRLHLFVRNWGKGVSSRIQQPDGSWSDWADLKGGAIQDGLAAVTAPSGLLSVFGAGQDRVCHWYQDQQTGNLSMAPRFRLTTPADPPTAVLYGNQLMVFYRRPASAGFFGARSTPEGAWNESARYIGGRGGFGPLAAAVPPGHRGPLLLAGRNDFGGLGYRFLNPAELDPEPPTAFLRSEWHDLDAPPGGLAHSPSAAFDAAGHAVIAALGADGRLYLRRQLEPGIDTFGDWDAIG